MGNQKKRRPGDIERAMLEAQGIGFDVLSYDETVTLQRRWREVFAADVARRTGTAVHLGFDWHAFSYDFTAAIRGAEAIAAYRKRDEREAFAIPDASAGRCNGFRCRGARLPDFTGRDMLIVPTDFGWTMAFTHEQPDIGPFFALNENS